MTAGYAGADLSRWYHGASAAVECLDGCGELGTNLTDAQALRLARRHANERAHYVMRSRTLFQDVRPMADVEAVR